MPEKPTPGEIAGIASDPWMPAYTGLLTPQDDVIARRGGPQGAALYDEGRRDPEAFTVLSKRTMAVIEREWRVDPASDRRADKRAAEVVRAQLDEIGLDRLTKGLLGAILKGYAVAEVMWEHRDGLWIAAAAKTRNQRRFRFDASGNLRLLTRGSMLAGIEVPARKMVVHRYTIHDHDDDLYGCGIGSVIYWPALFKRQVLAAWLQSNERHSDPTTWAQYSGQYDQSRQKEILDHLRNLGRNGKIVTPDDISIAYLQAASSGGSYRELSEYLDQMLTKAVLGETLSTSAGDNGSRALGEVHNDVRLALAKADADLVCDTINRTLVRWIIEVNALPIAAGYPKLWRDFSEPDDLDKLSERDERLDRMGYRAPVKYINDTYGGDRVDIKATPPADAPASAEAAPDPSFAEAVGVPVDRVPDVLASRALAETAPARARLIDRLREIWMSAGSYDELIQLLLQASPDLDVSDVASVLADALAAADVIGRSEVTTDGD